MSLPPREFKSLVQALDATFSRRPKRFPYPVVVFTRQAGQEDAQIVTRYGQRLDSRNIPHDVTRVPHAKVLSEQDIETLIAGRDDRAHPADGLIAPLRRDVPGWLRQGFPRFTTCRAALSAEHRTDEHELVRVLYDEFLRRHGLIKDLRDSGGALAPALWAPIQLILRLPLLRWGYAFWLRRTRSLSWIPALHGVNVNVIRHLSTCPVEVLGEWKDRILVEAFLRDLEWQLRSSRFSVGRRRRLPFVLLVPEAPREGTARRFVEECATVLAEWGQTRRHAWRTPVRILAAFGSDGPEAGADRPFIAIGDMTLTPVEPESAPAGDGDRVMLVVPVPAAETGGTAATDGGVTPWPAGLRRNRWYDHVFPAVNLLAPAAIIAAAAVIVAAVIISQPRASRSGAARQFGPCAGTWWQASTAERVGITDGTCIFSADPGLPGLERTIAAQNAQVLAMHRQDPSHRPYRTVVVFSPLTVSKIPGGVGRNSIDEVRGVALAQADIISAARNDPSVVPIRVLLANSGDRVSAAPQVADSIVARAASDGTLAAIIGISQSRTQSHQAIQRLSSLELPVIGSTTTSDQILDSSPLYYEIAPRDVREAQAIAQFLSHQPVMTGPQGQSAIARNAVVIEDPRDEYSQNLAADFRASFTALGNRIVATFDYGPPGEGLPPHDPGNIGDTPEPSADQLMNDVCNTIRSSPDLVFYASRAQQLPAILDKVNQEAACGGRQLGIMGSDEVTRYIADGTINLAQQKAVHFYNAAFSDPSHPSTPAAAQFAARYKQHYGQPPGDSGAADAYDAFTAASKAINLAYQQDPSIPRGAVAAKMADGLVQFTGVTGLIAISDAHDTSRVPADKPIFVVQEQPSGPVTLLACGRYAQGPGNEWLTWGSGGRQFPCPQDPSP